jgi:hypothetical protein
MTDPATDYRKEIEATSPEITGLLVKHKDNATMQVIGKHVEALYGYAQVLEAQAGIYKTKHDHFHVEGNKVYSQGEYQNKPVINNIQQHNYTQEVYHKRENIMYRLTGITLNAAHIGALDVAGARVLVSGAWIALKDSHQANYLKQLIDSDNR